MKLATAQLYARKIGDWITPYCDRVEIAGSIRRERPVCNDVDLVCIPKVRLDKDLMGETTEVHNLLFEFMQKYVAESGGKASFGQGGNIAGKLLIVNLPKCQLDLFFAAPENFDSRFLCRTGSKEHNIWLAQRALERGMKWMPYEGLVSGAGEIIPVASETDLYGALGLRLIRPQDREQAWINKHLESGL